MNVHTSSSVSSIVVVLQGVICSNRTSMQRLSSTAVRCRLLSRKRQACIQLTRTPNLTRSFTLSKFYAKSSPGDTGVASSQPSKRQALNPQDPIVPKLSITFTCTVPDCNTRSTHQFTKHAYEKGIVLVECPGCKNRHLIADHLGWFKDDVNEGRGKTIEDIMRAKGETVRRGQVQEDGSGVIEYVK